MSRNHDEWWRRATQLNLVTGEFENSAAKIWRKRPLLRVIISEPFFFFHVAALPRDISDSEIQLNLRWGHDPSC